MLPPLNGLKSEGQAQFTKDQLEMLQHLVSQAHQSATFSAIGIREVAQRGNTLALHAMQAPSASWIVDFGAFDQITGDRSLSSSYNPCHGALTIRIANRS